MKKGEKNKNIQCHNDVGLLVWPTYVNKGPHLMDQIMENNIFERS